MLFRSDKGKKIEILANFHPKLHYIGEWWKQLYGIEYIFKELDEIYRIMPLHEPVLTKELVKAWRESRLNDSERTLYDKWSIISQFSRYMCHCGFVCYVPPMPKQKDKSFISKIFTHEEIERFFIAADSLRFHNIQPTLCLFSMPTLFRVLYATGIRIGEALNLNIEDVNLEKGTILIRKSKNQRQRIVPITPSLEAVLHQYISYRDRMPLKSIRHKESPLFISHIPSTWRAPSACPRPSATAS